MTRLEVRRLTGPARGRLRVEDVSLVVESRQVGALFGRAQSGKRTLLRMLSGLERHASGDILLNDSSVQHLPAHHRRIAAVFQDSPMFPGSVHDNIVYGLERVRWPSGDRERRVAEALELVGMTGTERERASALPADERWRIALARAIAPAPPVLLIESPTWPVDEVARPDFSAALRAVLKSIGVTALIATDDLRDAVSIADDLHVIENGRILQSGSLSRVLAGPSSIAVAEMVGYHTIIRGEVSSNWIIEAGVGAVAFPAGFPLSGNARALAHPAAMLGVPDASGLGVGVSGVVERIRAIGPTHLLDLRVGDRLIEVRWEWDPAPPPLGTPIAIAVTPGTLRFFNDTTPQPAPEQGDEDDTAELRPRSWAPPELSAAPAVAAASEASPAPLDETPDAGRTSQTASALDAPAWSEAWRAASTPADETPAAEALPGPSVGAATAGFEQVDAGADVPWTPEPWPDGAPGSIEGVPDTGPERPEEPTQGSALSSAPVVRSELTEDASPAAERIEHETPAEHVMTPWLSASKPPAPVSAPPPLADADDTDAPATGRRDSSRRHEGMPLD